jgi:hypothetical protein
MEVDCELTLCKTIIKDGAGWRFMLNLGISGRKWWTELSVEYQESCNSVTTPPLTEGSAASVRQGQQEIYKRVKARAV